jgi:hypothetical protein
MSINNIKAEPEIPKKPVLKQIIATFIITMGVGLGVVLILVIALVAYLSFATQSAESQARTLCREIQIGMSREQALRIVQQSASATEPKLIHIDNDWISVGFKGAIMDRWMCNVKIQQGKITRSEIRLLD